MFVFPEHIRSTERLTFITEANIDSQVLLNELGMQKAIEYARDISEIERYRVKIKVKMIQDDLIHLDLQKSQYSSHFLVSKVKKSR